MYIAMYIAMYITMYIIPCYITYNIIWYITKNNHAAKKNHAATRPKKSNKLCFIQYPPGYVIYMYILVELPAAFIVLYYYILYYAHLNIKILN